MIIIMVMIHEMGNKIANVFLSLWQVTLQPLLLVLVLLSQKWRLFTVQNGSFFLIFLSKKNYGLPYSIVFLVIIINSCHHHHFCAINIHLIILPTDFMIAFIDGHFGPQKKVNKNYLKFHAILYFYDYYYYYLQINDFIAFN